VFPTRPPATSGWQTAIVEDGPAATTGRPGQILTGDKNHHGPG
jgi:hypothetical protein